MYDEYLIKAFATFRIIAGMTSQKHAFIYIKIFFASLS